MRVSDVNSCRLGTTSSIETGVSGKPSYAAKDRSEFLFRQHVDLQVEFRPPIGFLRHPVLRGQHE